MVDKLRHTKGASVLFPNPFQQDIMSSEGGEDTHEHFEHCSGGSPAVAHDHAGHCSGGSPAVAQATSSKKGYVIALRRFNHEAVPRRLDGEEQVSRRREYPAIAAPTWVMGTGASYDVAPTGVASAK